MAVLALAAPPYRSLHLHERLQAELGRRGHQCAAWCDDPRAARFWQDQGFAAVPVRPGAADPLRVPVHELAADEATRRGLVAGSPAHRRVVDAVTQRLARLVPAALRLFEQQRPDLLLACGDRRAERRLLAFLARELGVRVLWFAPGLLPHTLQHDESGLDGDAAIVRRTAGDYRDVMLQTRLLAVMEGELTRRDWLVGTTPTLADVAVYSYVAHAPEGNVSLDDYPQVRAWLGRVEALPGFVAMPVSKVGLRA